MELRFCTECGKPFYTALPNKLTCGRECSRARQRRRGAEYYENNTFDINDRRKIRRKEQRTEDRERRQPRPMKKQRTKTDWRAITKKCKELGKSYGQAVADGDI